MDPTDLRPGVCLSGHLLTEEIGVGGFSRVFRADPEGGGPSVAIKIAVEPELVAALRSEGAVLRRLTGPRFVKILEEHLEDDPPFFVLELCRGGDLRALLDRSPGKRLPPDEVVRLITAILEGCAFAHDEGVIHGDLKPENILLDEAGNPKIADLGLSRAHRLRLLTGEGVLAPSVASGNAGKVRGTFDYLAPETRKGNEISPASDVFALGVLLYELLTGKRPLGVFQLPRAALAKEGIDVPRALDRVVERALAHDTSERYPDASIMLADLLTGEYGLSWTAETKGPARAPRIFRVEPVNDLLFAAHMYTAIVVPAFVFGVVFTAIRDRVPSLATRVCLWMLALALVALVLVRLVRRRKA